MAVETVTFEGAPRGSILALPSNEIPDDGARYIQDGLLYSPGEIIRRGIVQPVSGVASLPDDIQWVFQTAGPNGVVRIAVVHGLGPFKLAVLSDDYTTYTDIVPDLVPGFDLSNADWYTVQRQGGGAWLGIGIAERLYLWQGANKPAYTTGTIASTVGSTTVTGSGTLWTANVSPGMFLYVGAAYLGTVKSVTSNTSLELVDPCYATNAAGTAYALKAIRPMQRHVTTGRISCETTGTGVTGGSTKFRSQLFTTTGGWWLFRASDMAFIGTTSSVTNETSLVLTANALVAMDEESYIALPVSEYVNAQNATTTPWQGGAPGHITATYAGRQWYAYKNRVFFADGSDPESVDVSQNDGDFIEVTPTVSGAGAFDINALVPTFNALLLLRLNEIYAMAGDAPSNFTLQKIGDEGCISPGSVQTYRGGAIYAGRDGIYLYDGSRVTNIVQDTLGDFYKGLVRQTGVGAGLWRMHSMIEADHYFLFIEVVTTSYSIRKGTSVKTPTKLTISVHLPSLAVSFLSNVEIHGAVRLPDSTGKGQWYAVRAGRTGYDVEGDFSTIAQWGVANATLATVGSEGQLTLTATGVGTALFHAIAKTPAAGDSFTGSIFVRGVGGSIGKTVYIQLSELGGAFGGEQLSNGAAISAPLTLTSTPQLLTVTGTVNRSDRTNIYLYVVVVTPTAGDQYYFKQAVLEDGTVVHPFCKPGSYFCSARDLFATNGIDGLQCTDGFTNTPFGPDFYIESKRYSLGDSLWKKLWKLMLLRYACSGDDLKFETLTGTSDTGTVSANDWLATGSTTSPPYAEKRRRFTKRSQLFGFRIYQKSNAVKALKLGAWSLGSKPLRKGRV
jgi:hypothetical protein